MITPGLQQHQNPPPKIPWWGYGIAGAVALGLGYLAYRTWGPSAKPVTEGDGGGEQKPTPLPAPPIPPVEPEPTPQPPPPIPEIVDVQTKTAGELDLGEYPWGDESTVYVHPSAPTPSMIYQVKQGDTMLGTVRNAAAAALALAGREELVVGMNPNSAEYKEEWAKRLREQMRDALVCGWFNDTSYGQTNTETAGGQFGMGPHGRGLNWKPRHADNVQRLKAAQLVRRTTTMSGVRDVPAQEAQSQMALWIPAPNLEKLQGPKESLNFVFDLEWSNGTSALNPPPSVTVPGIEDAIFDGGCPGWKQ